MTRLATLFLLAASGCANAQDDGVVTADPHDPSRLRPQLVDRSDHLGAAPEGWTPRERKPLGTGRLAADDGSLVLKHTDVFADVSAGLALVEVTQQFHNPFDRALDATYMLPLPPDAAVRGFRLECGGRVIEGEIRDKQSARREYERARQNGQKAALLEQVRENLFTQAVSGICPNETVAVTVEYVQQIPRDDGRAFLIFPTTVGERFEPSGIDVPDHVPAPERGGRDISIVVELDEGLPIQSLWSDSHRIEVWNEDDRGATVVLDPSDGVPNKDFGLSWMLGADAPRGAVTVRPKDGSESGYFAVSLEPQVLVDLEQQRARELLFVLDASCSMRGQPWDLATDTVRHALDEMGPDDTFNLVKFSDSAASLFSAPQRASRANVERAKAWLGQYHGGGTHMTAGILHSLHMPGDPEALRLILMLTDGYIGNDREIVELVDRELGDARIFSMGIGSSPNHLLLENLAEIGRGTVSYQRPSTPVGETVDAFYDRIAHPAMTDLSVDFDGLETWDVYPSRIPDLWAGQPLQLVGRFSGSGRHDVTVNGSVNGVEHRIRIPVDLARADQHEAVRTLWARRKIHDATYDLDLIPADRLAEITATALQHHLVSETTSLIAVEREPSSCGPAGVSVDVAHYGPEGSRLDTVPPTRRARPAPRPMSTPRPAPQPAPRPATPHRPGRLYAPVAAEPEPEPAPAVAPAPKPVAVGHATVISATGELDRSAVQRVFRTAIRELTRGLASGQRIVAVFEVDADGRPTEVSTGHAALDAAIRRLRFSGPGVIRVEIMT